MFEKFTDRARRVVVFAQEESRLLSHNYIGTEHILLGLLAEGEGIAAQALNSFGLTREAVRDRVVEMVGRGDEVPSNHIPLTAEAKNTLETALREAIQIGHNYIGTEHILLGLLAMPDSVASQALHSLGVEAGLARDKVGELLGDSTERVVMEPPIQYPTIRPTGSQLARRSDDSALISLVFVLVALVAVQLEPPAPEISTGGLSLLLGGVLLWAGGAFLGTRRVTPRAQGAVRYLRLLGALTLAAAAVVFTLGALLI